ncbi:DUF6920 family protein, partial [Desulfolithobacter sp.]
MKKQWSLDDLWSSAQSGTRVFDPAQVSGLPEGVRLYLGHAIAAGTPLASAVRLLMHGEIKLKGWHSFTAEQVIVWQRGMIWQAMVRMFGVPVRGGDFFLDGQGAMRWKFFGILPVVNVAGPNISRSAAGRVNIESIWLPSVLCGEGVSWTAASKRLHARFSAHGERAGI